MPVSRPFRFTVICLTKRALVRNELREQEKELNGSGRNNKRESDWMTVAERRIAARRYCFDRYLADVTARRIGRTDFRSQIVKSAILRADLEKLWFCTDSLPPWQISLVRKCEHCVDGMPLPPEAEHDRSGFQLFLWTTSRRRKNSK